MYSESENETERERLTLVISVVISWHADRAIHQLGGRESHMNINLKMYTYT